MQRSDPPATERPTGLDESFAGWQTAAGGWERQRAILWDASRGVSERLVELLEPLQGETLLEIAAGTGDTGFLAAERIGPAGRLISSDLVPEMLAAARRRASELGLPNVDFRVLDAQALDLSDESVDCVLCRWGYMLVSEPAAALSETRRILRPGGRVAFAVWAGADENPWASTIGRVLVERGLMARPQRDTPGPFRLADSGRVRTLVLEAGLELSTQEDITLTWRYGSLDEYWNVTLDLSTTLSAIVATLGDQELASIRADVRQALEPYVVGEGLVMPALSRLALARRM